MPELLAERFGEREAALPAGQVAGAGDDAGLLVGVAGGADADAAQRAGLDAGRLGRFAQRRRHRRGDVLGAAAGRRRLARFAQHLAAGVDDRRLDLRPAEVDAAAQVSHAWPVRASLLPGSGKLGPWLELTDWRIWWAKRRWYERNHRRLRRWRIDRHAARGGFFIRHPVEGEVLEALDEGRLTIGEGTLLEPGCWLTLAPEARIEIGEGCFLNRNTMIAAHERVTIGDHTMFANGCFVGDASHRFDDPDTPITWQGFTSKGPVEIGANCWFGVNCAVTSGVTIG